MYLHCSKQPSMANRDRILLYGYTTLVAAILAIVIDWQAPQNFDNGIRIWLLTQPWSVLLHNISVIELAPPFWHIFGKSALTVSPLSAITTLRILNYLFFISMIPLGYQAGKMLDDRKAAWATALLIPWSPFLIDFITRTDHYTLYAALAVAYTAALATLLRAPTRKRIIGYALTTVAFSFTHYYALTYVGGTALVALALHILSFDRRKILQKTWKGIQQQELGTYSWFSSPSLLPLIIPFLPVTLIYVAWLPIFYDQYIHYQSGVSPEYSSIVGLATTAIWFIGGQLPAFGPVDFPISIGVLTVIFVTAPLGFTGLWTVVDKRDRVQLVIIGGAIMGAAIFLLSGRFYSLRHGLWMAAIAPVVMGLGAGAIMDELRERLPSPNRTPKIVAIGIVILLAVSAAPTLATINETTEVGTNVDRAASIVQNSHTPNSVILSTSPWGEFILRAHGVNAPIHGIPEDAVDGNRALRGRGDYAPETHPRDLERVERLVEGKERVIVFNAHGMIENRLPPLLQDLDKRGFSVNRKYEKRANGVIILERDD